MQMRLLLSSIALATLFIFANARAADDRVKIGVLTDMNGPYAAITGKGSVAAAELAIEDFGGKALDKPLELVVVVGGRFQPG
jgi:branched-chain amino acid transport system substrate-binding protein